MKLISVDRTTNELIDVGDIAVMTRDGGSVIYSDEGQLWKLDLTQPAHERHRLQGEGWPADASADGKLILVTRKDTSKQWTIDDEIWVMNTVTKSERKIAVGHSAILFGSDLGHILYFSGYDRIPFVTPIDGGESIRVQCLAGYKMPPLVSWDGGGAVVGSFSKGRGESYDALFISCDSFLATRIASFGCDSASFITPIIGKR